MFRFEQSGIVNEPRYQKPNFKRAAISCTNLTSDGYINQI